MKGIPKKPQFAQACEYSDEPESSDNYSFDSQKEYDEEIDEQNSKSTKDESNMLSKNDVTEASSLRLDSVKASAINLSSTMEINHLDDDLINIPRGKNNECN